MKKSELLELGLADEVADKILAIHGKDIEKHKQALTAAETERDNLKSQLEEANSTIEAFKKLDVDAIQRAADEWKAKAEAAERSSAEQIYKLKFDYALESALVGAKAKNTKAVRALLDLESLKLDENGQISGLDKQLEKIRAEADYLFDSGNKEIKVVTGGTDKTQTTLDAVVAAARAAAGLK